MSTLPVSTNPIAMVGSGGGGNTVTSTGGGAGQVVHLVKTATGIMKPIKVVSTTSAAAPGHLPRSITVQHHHQSSAVSAMATSGATTAPKVIKAISTGMLQKSTAAATGVAGKPILIAAGGTAGVARPGIGRPVTGAAGGAQQIVIMSPNSGELASLLAGGLGQWVGSIKFDVLSHHIAAVLD